MIQNLTMTDPILEEIHQTRRKISERFGGDLRAILDDARERQAVSGRPIWSPQENISQGHKATEKAKNH